jgi:hypothetical protein
MPTPVMAMAQLLSLVDEAFDRAAWHGPTLRGSLRGVTAAQASWRPARGRHHIREIAIHAAYWKHAVRRRLLGRGDWTFPLKGANWFDIEPGRSWKGDLRMLDDEHRALRAAIAGYPESALNKVIDKRGQRAAFTIRGIAAHDLYHAGQIQLIRALWKGR